MSKLENINAPTRPPLTSLPAVLRVLTVDAEAFDRTRMRRLIDAFEVETHATEADSLSTMRAMLSTATFDLIVFDGKLLNDSGQDALDAVLGSHRNRSAATMMLVGDGEDALAIKALQRGCGNTLSTNELGQSGFFRAALVALQKAQLAADLEPKEANRHQTQIPRPNAWLSDRINDPWQRSHDPGVHAADHCKRSRKIFWRSDR